MSCILHIETSTSACSVAVSEDGQNVFKKEDLNGPSHAVSLGIFVDEALSFADSHTMPLDAVAVSCGPGSYTGLRIGVSMAKGVCYGRNPVSYTHLDVYKRQTSSRNRLTRASSPKCPALWPKLPWKAV